MRLKLSSQVVVLWGLGVGVALHYGGGALGSAVWTFALWLVFRLDKRHVYSDLFVKVATPPCVGVLSVALYSEAYDWAFMRPFLQMEMDPFYTEQYYSVISTLFAIITALILVKGIESFDRLDAAINEEANRIRSMNEFLRYFEDGAPPETLAVLTDIRGILHQYCANVVEQAHAEGTTRNRQLLEDCVGVVSRLECRDDNDRIALGEIMKIASDLFGARSRRISCAKAKVPSYLIYVLSLMSLAIVLPFFMLPPEPVTHNVSMIFVLANFCAFVLILLVDINSPFDGFWRVDLAPFRQLRDEIMQMESAVRPGS